MASLAARCKACGTVFRVVQDQLRVAGGFVRCGRCGEVFNATETLIELDASGTAAMAPQPAAAVGDPGTHFELQMAPPPPPPPPPRDKSPPLPDAEEPPAIVHVEAAADAREPEPAFAPEPGHDLEPHAFAAAPLPSAPHSDDLADLRADPPAPTVQRTPDRDVEDAPPAASPTSSLAFDPHAEPDPQPTFVRSADRAQRWRQPRVRAALAVACVLGVLLLAGQAVHTWRDQIAARYPDLRPTLVAACAALGCRIEAARAIDSLAVESSGLVRVEKSSVYRLQIALRNRSAMALALPAVDLTLSDSQGKPMARRVLRAGEFGVTEATLGAGRELALQATLQTALQPATEPVAGYTIELFYP